MSEFIMDFKEVVKLEGEIVDCLFGYIDRMNDTCEKDPAEKVLTEFVNAVFPLLEKHCAALHGPVIDDGHPYYWSKENRKAYDECSHKRLIRKDGAIAICGECDKYICGGGGGLCFGDPIQKEPAPTMVYNCVAYSVLNEEEQDERH